MMQNQSASMSLSVERNRAKAAFNAEVAEGVVMEVESATDLKSVNKYNQADASMHTLDAWEKRFALRRDKQVRQALHLWWMAALRTIQSEQPDEPFPVLDKSTYLRIYKLVFRALAKEVSEKYDEEEAVECAEEDWESDSRDGLTMPREQFMDALFQIADLYTDDAIGSDYAVFLERQLGRCLAKGFNVGDEKSVFWKVKAPKKKKKDPESQSSSVSETPTPSDFTPSEVESARPIATPEAMPAFVVDEESVTEGSEMPSMMSSRLSTPDSLYPGEIDFPMVEKRGKKKKKSKPAPSPREMAPATKREVADRPVTEKFEFDPSNPWRSGRDVNSLSGPGGPSMDWRDNEDEKKPRGDSPIWYSAGVGSGPPTLEAMDWGEREVEKPAPFVLKSPRKAERKVKRKAQKARKATVKVQSHVRKNKEVAVFAETKAAVVKMQTHARAHTAKVMFVAARKAAELIQRTVRRRRPPTPPPPPPPPEPELPPYELPPAEPDPPPRRKARPPPELWLQPLAPLPAPLPAPALPAPPPPIQPRPRTPPPPQPPPPQVIREDPMMPSRQNLLLAPKPSMTPNRRDRGPMDRVKSPIYVRTLEGPTFEFHVTNLETVADVKEMVQRAVRAMTTGQVAAPINIVFEGRPLVHEHKTLSEYNVWKLSLLECAPAAASRPRSKPMPLSDFPEAPQWTRPLVNTASAASVLRDVRPVYSEHKIPKWSARPSSWESDHAARTVMKRLGREDSNAFVMRASHPLLTATHPNNEPFADPYIPNMAFFAAPSRVPPLDAMRSLPAGAASPHLSSVFQPLPEAKRADIKSAARASYRAMGEQLRAIERMGSQVQQLPLSKLRKMQSSASLPQLRLPRPVLVESHGGHYVELLELATAISNHSPCAAGALEPLKRGAISNQIY